MIIRAEDLSAMLPHPVFKNIFRPFCSIHRTHPNFRSPESWARARQNTPSDVFSFGAVVIYVMLNDMIFHVSDERLGEDDAWRHILRRHTLRRHISYFGDEDGFKGLLQHIGEENMFFGRLIALAGDFDAERPRKPFAMWHYVDAELRDLAMRMANLDA